MKISTKGRYGTRLMLELANAYNSKKPLMLREIAEKQGISLKYLEQIVILLKRAGLIRALRGAKGGYILAKPPSDITLERIITTLEGDLSVVECISYPETCNRVDECITRELWKAISKKIRETLNSFTLEDLSNKISKR